MSVGGVDAMIAAGAPPGGGGSREVHNWDGKPTQETIRSTRSGRCQPGHHEAQDKRRTWRCPRRG